MHGRKLITTGTVAALAILAVVGGCREATTGPTTVRPQDFASSLKLLSGNQQTGAVGVPLPELLSVKVVDAGGQAVAGATVLWQVRDGGGTINPAASTSSSSGLATVTWTLGTTLGANKVVAVLQGNYTLDSAVFTATAGTGPANQFTATAGNLQTGRVTSTLGTPLAVNVKDQFGHPIVGARVVWAPGNIFSGTVVAVNDSTDATGSATAMWTLGLGAIAQTATATVAGLPPIVFNATATADTSRVITQSTGSGQSAAAGTALATKLQVTVTDRFGNVISGETVFFNDSLSSGGTVSPVQAVTDATGKASTTWTLGNLLGVQAVRARVASTLAKATFTATATAQFAQVYAGNYFTCGVTTADKAFCWGFGEDGQRGAVSLKTTNAPGAGVTLTDTLTGVFPTWRSISAGSSYICGISIARQLYCWGKLASTGSIPRATLKIFNNVLSFTSVSTSETHSCTVTTDGEIGCTGANVQGQLGDGTQGDQISDYVVVKTVAPNARLPWSAVVTGGSHTCAFPRFNPADSTNTLRPWCWGANGSGQLGNRTVSIDSTVPQGLVMTGLTQVWDTTSLVAGVAHTCALTREPAAGAGGAAYCWGSNGYGQLGGGSALVRDTVPMAVTMPAGVTGFTRLFAGEYHTCGIANTGAAYCWGRNTSGQLGDNSKVDRNAPVPVAGGFTWRSLATGELHTCGVTSPTGLPGGTQAGNGVLYCWGDNEYGQLGTGVYGNNGQPVLSPQQKVAGQP